MAGRRQRVGLLWRTPPEQPIAAHPTPVARLQIGMFEPKEVPKAKLAPLAAAYVGYIVLCNLNLNINPVGFYQITKIAVAPAVLAIEAVYYGRRASRNVVASVGLVCLGVGLATITDPQISSNLSGLAAGFGSVAATALYQIWAGVKQKELGLGSMQLLHQYVPLAALLLAVLVPLCEPMGWSNPTPQTILGYRFTLGSVAAIAVSSVLGLLVNLSTFLVIGATSRWAGRFLGRLALPRHAASQGPTGCSPCETVGAVRELWQRVHLVLMCGPPTPSCARPAQLDLQCGGSHQDGADPHRRRALLWRLHALQEDLRHRRGHGRHHLVQPGVCVGGARGAEPRRRLQGAGRAVSGAWRAGLSASGRAACLASWGGRPC